jgi:hypothetical protein
VGQDHWNYVRAISSDAAPKNPCGVNLLVAGVVLLVYGITASNSVGSGMSQAFTGTPTDKSMWLIISGAVAAVGGLVISQDPITSVSMLGQGRSSMRDIAPASGPARWA